MGRSKSLMGPRGRVDKYVDSNISYGNNSPSRTEGNRVFIHAFSEGHKEFFFRYQLGLERLSGRVPLATLNRDEQLAYWLNLYNMIVLNKLIEEYPVTRLDFLREGKRGKPAFWNQKVTTIEGYELSLKDIEAILFHNYDTPLVIYGLWQGAIGGPNLPNQAFTGDTVWKILTKGAVEFVNSNRGVRPKKNKLQVSLIYDWFAEAFPGTGYSLMGHIYALADPAFLGDISHISRAEPGYYDWIIADMIGGVLHQGRESSSTLINDQLFRISPGTTNTLRGLPPQALQLLEEVVLNNDLPQRVPLITTEECGPDEVCDFDNIQPDDGS